MCKLMPGRLGTDARGIRFSAFWQILKRGMAHRIDKNHKSACRRPWGGASGTSTLPRRELRYNRLTPTDLRQILPTVVRAPCQTSTSRRPGRGVDLRCRYGSTLRGLAHPPRCTAGAALVMGRRVAAVSACSISWVPCPRRISSDEGFRDGSVRSVGGIHAASTAAPASARCSAPALPCGACRSRCS
jgi:hypothetical protein